MLMVIMLVHIKVACWLQSVEHHVYNTSWRSRMRFMAEKVVVRYGGRVYSAFCTLYGAPHCIIHSWTKRIDIDCDYSVSNPSSLPRSCKIGMAGDAWCFCYMFQYVPICSNMFQYVPIYSNMFQYVPMLNWTESDWLYDLYGTLQYFTASLNVALSVALWRPACTTAGGHKTSGCFSWRHSSSQASLDAKLPGHSSKTSKSRPKRCPHLMPQTLSGQVE